METMNYYTHAVVTLDDIEVLARSAGYSSDRFINCLNLDRLNIYFGQDAHMWWQWSKYEAENLCLEDDARDRLNRLAPTTILLFEYYPRWLAEIIKFMTIVLEKHGGYLDCTGDVDVMYTLENIDGLLTGCP